MNSDQELNKGIYRRRFAADSEFRKGRLSISYEFFEKIGFGIFPHHENFFRNF